MDLRKPPTKVKRRKSPLDKFTDMINLVRFCSRLAGLDIFGPNFKPNWSTYLVFAVIMVFYIFSLLTIIKFFNDDWTILLEVFTNMSTATQGLVKFISGVIYSKTFYKLYEDVDGIYKEYQQKGNRYERVLSNFGDKMIKILASVGIIYFVTFSLAIIIPIAILLYNGNQYMMLLIHVPGVDVNTDQGFMITTIFHTGCVLLAGFGMYGGDLLVLIFLTHSLLFCEIIILKVQDLNDLIANDNNEESNTLDALTDMVEWHQFYLRFNDTCNHIMYWIISMQIFASTISVIITMIIIMTKDWPNAYVYLIMNCTALYIYCILGTRIEICNEQICAEIYNINWFGLNVSQEKLIRLMLMKSQSPNYINIAGVLPLTVNTALRITKTIYSIFMMMLRLVD